MSTSRSSSGTRDSTSIKIIQSGIIDPSDLSSTAKQLTVTLGASDAPIVIKADPQVVGDLLASTSATAMFHIKVNQDAPAGTYQVPVVLNYTYLYQAEQEGTDTLNYQYKTVNENITLPIKIKSEVQIAVPDVDAGNLNAGNEGYVNVTIKNIGYEEGRNAAVRIQQNDQSPVTPTEGSVYIGDFPGRRGGYLPVQGDGLKRCPAEDLPARCVLVNYKNSEGDYVNSTIETIGVPIGKKVDFNVTPIKARPLRRVRNPLSRSGTRTPAGLQRTMRRHGSAPSTRSRATTIRPSWARWRPGISAMRRSMSRSMRARR